jgi:hypothetical protein
VLSDNLSPDEIRYDAISHNRIVFRHPAEYIIMKNIITSILIGVVLYFLYPIIARFIPNHHLLVLAISGGVISYLVILIMGRFN